MVFFRKMAFLSFVTFFSSDAAAVLLETVDISAAGNGKRMLLGDVTGDGRLEMIMMQPNRMDDDRYIGHEVNCLTVYTVDGTRLWQNGDPSRGGSAGADIAAQVYDIDQDGFNEVLACMNGKFRVFDGKTGEEESSFDYPHQNAHDCIVIANLTGNEKPQDIILKDRYNQIWAMDRTGKQLWTYQGIDRTLFRKRTTRIPKKAVHRFGYTENGLSERGFSLENSDTWSFPYAKNIYRQMSTN